MAAGQLQPCSTTLLKHTSDSGFYTIPIVTDIHTQIPGYAFSEFTCIYSECFNELFDECIDKSYNRSHNV